MISKLRVLGLALTAVFALGVVGAQAASASTQHQFEFGEHKAIITGKQIGAHEFTVGSVGTVKCTTATFESTVDNGFLWQSDEITVKPNYSGCEFGGQAATVFFNDCAYVFDSDTTSGNSTGGEHAWFAIECAKNNSIKIHTINCTITVGPQTIADGVSYAQDTKEGVPVISAINVTTTAHGIVVGKERNTAGQPANGCLLFPTGAVGKYTGLATFECRMDESFVQGNPTTPVGTEDGGAEICELF